jgi:hypothetical protein
MSVSLVLNEHPFIDDSQACRVVPTERVPDVESLRPAPAPMRRVLLVGTQLPGMTMVPANSGSLTIRFHGEEPSPWVDFQRCWLESQQAHLLERLYSIAIGVRTENGHQERGGFVCVRQALHFLPNPMLT